MASCRLLVAASCRSLPWLLVGFLSLLRQEAEEAGLFRRGKLSDKKPSSVDTSRSLTRAPENLNPELRTNNPNLQSKRCCVQQCGLVRGVACSSVGWSRVACSSVGWSRGVACSSVGWSRVACSSVGWSRVACSSVGWSEVLRAAVWAGPLVLRAAVWAGHARRRDLPRPYSPILKILTLTPPPHPPNPSPKTNNASLKRRDAAVWAGDALKRESPLSPKPRTITLQHNLQPPNPERRDVSGSIMGLPRSLTRAPETPQTNLNP